MTRHFFALLALLSGLAALNGPAHASMAEALACDASISASTCDDTAAEVIAANAPPSTPLQSAAAEQPLRAVAEPENLRLPVLIGIERAHE